MTELIKKHSTNITIGIISTALFLYVLQPIFEYVGNKIIEVGEFLGASYVDEVYAQISHLEIVDFSFFFYVIIHSAVIGGGIGLILAMWFKKPSRNLEANENDQEQKSKKKITLTVSLSFVVFAALILTSTKTYQMSAISSFKQHFRIISPYIETQEEQEIMSEWSLMKNKSDYEKVSNKVETIANDNGIKLPENRIYTLISM